MNSQADCDRYKQSPIWKTNLYRPQSVILNEIRNDLVQLRGKLNDFESGFTNGKNVVGDLHGLFTCGIIALSREIESAVARQIQQGDAQFGKSYSFSPRPIGLDICPGCFVCGSIRRGLGANCYLNNFAAYVKSKEDGENIVGWFNTHARLDYRENEPNYIQVKIGCCDIHLPHLEYLRQITSVCNVIRKADVEEAINFKGDK